MTSQRVPVIENIFSANDALAAANRTLLDKHKVFSINIIQEGREIGQGVAYLDDGTMVVVEDGRDQIGKQVEVVVTKVLQTAAGRMIFARLGNNV